jgi:hypothetical protein
MRIEHDQSYPDRFLASTVADLLSYEIGRKAPVRPGIEISLIEFGLEVSQAVCPFHSGLPTQVGEHFEKRYNYNCCVRCRLIEMLKQRPFQEYLWLW